MKALVTTPSGPGRPRGHAAAALMPLRAPARVPKLLPALEAALLAALLAAPPALPAAPPEPAPAASGDTILVVLPSGRVGIGTSDPRAELDVAGGIVAGALSAAAPISAPNLLRWSALAPARGAVLDTAALGQVHRLDADNAAGGGATLTLPAAAASPGALIGFVVRPLTAGPSAGQVALEARAGDTLDGRRRLVLVHGNSVVLLSDGQGWVSLAKKVDTDWVDGGPLSLRSTGDQAPKKSATPLIDRMLWRRVGDSMEVIWEYAQDAGKGEAGTGVYLADLPMRARIDVGKLSAFAAARLADVTIKNAPSYATPLGHGHLGVVSGKDGWGSQLVPLAYAEPDPAKPSAVCFTEVYVGRTSGLMYFGNVSTLHFGTGNFSLFARATVPILDW